MGVNGGLKDGLVYSVEAKIVFANSPLYRHSHDIKEVQRQEQDLHHQKGDPAG